MCMANVLVRVALGGEEEGAQLAEVANLRACRLLWRPGRRTHLTLRLDRLLHLALMREHLIERVEHCM